MKEPINEINQKPMKNNGSFSNLNDIIFKKYKLIEKIGEGSYSTVYLAKNIFTNEEVAAKLEKIEKNKEHYLEKEAYTLFYLKGQGISNLITFGRTKFYNILIQKLLGKSLNKIFNELNKKFTLKDICMIGIQVVETLRYIHNKNYIHGDLKPQNILIGKINPGLLYLIDFGIAKKYRTDRGKHVQYKSLQKITVTPRFCSINALKGMVQSRRDDLESLIYILMYFYIGKLPWENIESKNGEDRIKKINKMKNDCLIELNKNNINLFPKEFCQFANYITKLKFDETPDYDYIINLFKKTLLKNLETNDYIFSWVNDINLLKLDFPKSNRNKKSSLQQKLYNKLNESFCSRKSMINFKNETFLNDIRFSTNINYNIFISKCSKTNTLSTIQCSNILNEKNVNNFLLSSFYNSSAVSIKNFNNYVYTKKRVKDCFSKDFKNKSIKCKFGKNDRYENTKNDEKKCNFTIENNFQNNIKNKFIKLSSFQNLPHIKNEQDKKFLDKTYIKSKEND